MHGYKWPITDLSEDDLRLILEPLRSGLVTHYVPPGLLAADQVRFHIIRNARIENVGKSQSCMVSKLRIIWSC